MNACMRTGFLFADEETPTETRTGDLFLIGGMLQIRGVPSGIFEDIIPHAIVREARLHSRGEGMAYSDTMPGVEIVSCTDSFREFVEKWSPDMLKLLP